MSENRLSKLMGLAINDYNMLANGDRIVVGISGGMDSLALLLLMNNRLKRVPISYMMIPVIVDNFNGENPEHNYRINELKIYIDKMTGLILNIIKVNTVQKILDGNRPKRDTCYLCAQKRRNALIKFAFENKCTRIALGHHKDDIVETTLMNMLYKRELSSMVPKLTLFDGKIDIIRPLAYIQKTQIEDLIYYGGDNVPVFGEICPSKIIRRDSRRLKVRELIAKINKDIPNLKNNIFASFRNPKHDYLLDMHFDPKTSGLYKRP